MWFGLGYLGRGGGKGKKFPSGSAFFNSFGAAVVAFIGEGDVATTLTAAGHATVSFIGASLKASTLTAAGAATTAFIARSIAQGTLTALGVATTSFISAGSAFTPALKFNDQRNSQYIGVI